MEDIHFSGEMKPVMTQAFDIARLGRYQFVTPEMLLLGVTRAYPDFDLLTPRQTGNLMQYIGKYTPRITFSISERDTCPFSYFSTEILVRADKLVADMPGNDGITVSMLLLAIMNVGDTYASDVLDEQAGDDRYGFLEKIKKITGFPPDEVQDTPETTSGIETAEADDEWMDADEVLQVDYDLPFGENDESWRKIVTCLNDVAADHNPLVGREEEMARTMLILSRRDKNNPLFVGEAGVGKTSLAYGLAQLVEKGNVPVKLAGARIYSLEMTVLMSGTQYRGDLEKRLVSILDGLSKEDNPILFIDEIHTAIGSGRVENGVLDIANMLKPYLDRGDIRVIGSTTYDEYNRYFVKNQTFGRRFVKVDVAEPTTDQCIKIIMELKDKYESFHGICYTDEAIRHAVTASARYITDRHLPDKAIDLVDEAGALCASRSGGDPAAVVDKAIIDEVLARVCNVEMLSGDTDETARLVSLSDKLKEQIYGQDDAIAQVTEAVLMGASGLVDDNKPLASLLFVGPTGVGKTEVARVLALQLGVPLLRFDMSEYAEKHTVSKLIGAPSGYVGYDDGGLLTDAVLKTPQCVVLLDEIEKAHEDIYNVLLQVMDYASLTDNKGRKADFRHVVLIMTSNTGAQYSRNASAGFINKSSAGDVMLGSVKKKFKPEFINRLTAVTVFNDIDRDMAGRILDKKLMSLNDKLGRKKVRLTLSPEAREWLLEQGFSVTYGGREIERVINKYVKPLLSREMLFGKLRDGGDATMELYDGCLRLV